MVRSSRICRLSKGCLLERFGGWSLDCGVMVNGVEVHKRESYEFGEESSFIVTFIRQLRNSRLQRYRRFLKGVPALNDKRSMRGSYRLIRQAVLNDNEID